MPPPVSVLHGALVVPMVCRFVDDTTRTPRPLFVPDVQSIEHHVTLAVNDVSGGVYVYGPQTEPQYEHGVPGFALPSIGWLPSCFHAPSATVQCTA